MFTLEQIDDLHDRLGSAQTLLEHARALRALGVKRYTSYLKDGRTEYIGGGHSVVSAPTHEPFAVAETSDKASFLEHLQRHEQGQTSYLEMSRGLAASGIARWVVSTEKATMTFLDRSGDVLLTEKLT